MKRKKPGTGAPKGARPLSDYKTRETAATTSPVDIAVRNSPGRAKDATRKG